MEEDHSKKRLRSEESDNKLTIICSKDDLIKGDEKKSWMIILQSFVKENDELTSKLDILRKDFEKYQTHTKQMIKNPVSI